MNQVVTILSVPDVEHLINEINRLDLDGKDVLSYYSNEEIAKIYNGIGPDRFPSWARYFLTELNPVILPAVMIHDLDYDHGGTIEDFYASNKRLGTNGAICVNDKYGKYSIKRLFYLAKLYVFVKICNKYGKPGWNLKSC